MIKIEKILEVTTASKAGNPWNPPAQYTHFQPVDIKDVNIPYLSGFMIVLDLGLTTVGKRFKVTIEEMDEL